MKIIDIKAMKYLEDGSVSCEVLFEGRADYIPYRAVENDSAASGQRVWGTLMSGEFGEIIPFTVTAEMLDKEKELKKRKSGAGEQNRRRSRSHSNGTAAHGMEENPHWNAYSRQ